MKLCVVKLKQVKNKLGLLALFYNKMEYGIKCHGIVIFLYIFCLGIIFWDALEVKA